ncbi:hypothetical protein COO60DRAFT_1561434 [Scenedesmus sp. NREL 46B-D3]|nr:hypothetical protein COO60DRAFT_1561434 [Scenedesmus sp. NREL 46B-D3]
MQHAACRAQRASIAQAGWQTAGRSLAVLLKHCVCAVARVVGHAGLPVPALQRKVVWLCSYVWLKPLCFSLCRSCQVAVVEHAQLFAGTLGLPAVGGCLLIVPPHLHCHAWCPGWLDLVVGLATLAVCLFLWAHGTHPSYRS